MNERWLQGSGRGGGGQVSAAEGGGSGSYGAFPGGPSPYGIFAVPHSVLSPLSVLAVCECAAGSNSLARRARQAGVCRRRTTFRRGATSGLFDALFCARACVVGADSF